jgi:Fe-S-cluster containining protein
LEVLLLAGDDIPAHFIALDDWDRSIMARLGDGWCAALDRNTLKCRIYPRRPRLCREYALGGDGCLVERSALAKAGNDRGSWLG